MAMERQLEPELMLDPAQVIAYADADFSDAHQGFIQRFKHRFGVADSPALDLGCGPCDISHRFLSAFPEVQLDAVDGSVPMLAQAQKTTPPELANRLELIAAKLPDLPLPTHHYATLISNSLLHHLPRPQVLWQVIKRHGRPGAVVAVMDLLRPESPERARQLVAQYAYDAPDILKRDFYHSLRAAFTVTEIEQQLHDAGLDFACQVISDRHVWIEGRLAIRLNRLTIV